MLFNAVSKMHSCPKCYLVLKKHNPSVYKQPFYKSSLTVSPFLFQISIPRASSQLSSLPKLQQCAQHYNMVYGVKTSHSKT